jgi:pimeloyl-ACP methyl ester carboxylesterase
MIPFVLIPGLNCDARVYAGVIPTLWQFGSVMVASTVAGEGMTGIAAAILAAAPERFALAGFSMGGYLSFEILRQAPDRVVKLALIDTTAHQDTPDLTETRRRRIEQAEAGKFGLVLEQSFPASVHPDNVSDSGLYSIHRAMSEANGPAVYARHQRAIIARPDSQPGLAAIRMPTVVIVGEADQITPPEAAREIHEAIAGSGLVTIPRAGHLALVEQPALVAAALKEWAAP